MKGASHGRLLSTRGPSLEPGARPPLSPGLHLGLTRRTLERDKTEGGCVNSAAPRRAQLAIAALIKYRTLSHHNALLAVFPGKF